jgi:hypothetical protein
MGSAEFHYQVARIAGAFTWNSPAMLSQNPNIDLPTLFAQLETLLREGGFVPELICNTASGPILSWERTISPEMPQIYVSAGMHGDEPAGPLAVLELLRGGLCRDVNWVLCPVLNPTGLALGTRDNADGIDQNRDYLQRSSPEIIAHAAWLENRRPPDVFFSLHEDWEATGFYFYEINLRKEHQPHAECILERVAEHLTVEPGPMIDGHEATAPGWIYHAPEADLPDLWPEAIFLAKLGCPLSYTFETPSSAASLESRIQALVAAVRSATDLHLAEWGRRTNT